MSANQAEINIINQWVNLDDSSGNEKPETLSCSVGNLQPSKSRTTSSRSDPNSQPQTCWVSDPVAAETVMIEISSNPDEYEDPVLCKNINVSSSNSVSKEDGETESDDFDNSGESGDSQYEADDSFNPSNVSSNDSSNSTDLSPKTYLTPEEIIRKFRLKKRLTFNTNPETISSPYKNLVLSKPRRLNYFSQLNLEHKLRLPELNEMNYYTYQTDYICGVREYQYLGKLKLNAFVSCNNCLNCRNHNLTQKLSVKRSLPFEKLVLAELKYFNLFNVRRDFVLRQARSNRVFLNYGHFSMQNSRTHDSIVLGDQVPLKQGGKRRRVVRGSIYNASGIVRGAIGSITRAPLPSPSGLEEENQEQKEQGQRDAEIQTKQVELGEKESDVTAEAEKTKSSESNELTDKSNESQDHETYKKSNEDTVSASSQSSSGSSSSDADSNIGESQTKAYINSLSRNTSTRIKETVAYLHYKLGNT